MIDILEENLVEGYQRPVEQVGKDLLNAARITILNDMVNGLVDFSIYPYELPEIPTGKRIDVMFVLRPDVDQQAFDSGRNVGERTAGYGELGY